MLALKWNSNQNIFFVICVLGSLVAYRANDVVMGAIENDSMVRIIKHWPLDYTFFDKCGSGESSNLFYEELSALYRRKSQSAQIQIADVYLMWITGDCIEANITLEELTRKNVRHPILLAWLLSQESKYSLISGKDRTTLSNFAIKKAALFHDQKDFQTAQIWYERAYQLQPSWQSARVLAGLYEVTDQTEKTLQLWQSLVNIYDESTADYWWALAELESKDEAWHSAAASFEKGALLTASPYEFADSGLISA